MSEEVTLRDMLMPEFRHADPADYEFRGDGKIVRKDRWEKGIFEIARALGMNCRGGFEIPDVVYAVKTIINQIEPQGENPDDE